MKDNGAVKLRRVVKQLLALAGPFDVCVTPQGEGLVRVEKRTKDSESRTEFYFLVRIESAAAGETWWPVEYRSATEVISCESVVNGKVMVNLSKQGSLIELAETWAKTLEAQQVTKSVGNALL